MCSFRKWDYSVLGQSSGYVSLIELAIYLINVLLVGLVLFVDSAFIMFGKELDVAEGNNFIVENFESFTSYFPILLGYRFINYNNVGDVFSGVYHGVTIDFKVIGILAPNQSKGIGYLARHLDNSVVMPFVSHRYTELNDQEETRFWTSIYSQKTSSLMIVVNTPYFIDRAINEVHAGAHEAGFGSSYTLTSVMPHIWQMIETRNLVRHQQETMKTLFASIGIIMLIIINVLGSVKFRIREENYFCLMVTGYHKWKIIVANILEIVIIFGMTYFFIHDYLIFYSGFLEQRRGFRNLNVGSHHEVTRWWIYRFHWNNNNTLSYVTLYVIILCICALIYPIFKITKLYKKGW